jgi:hypothetical protein
MVTNIELLVWIILRASVVADLDDNVRLQAEQTLGSMLGQPDS